ncbi:MAG TPA: hypothetical protein VK783_11070 [Bacteroidia bacterium]|jgi:hypothetical protein|nr:hypothetical protein [Bacteroidia bacterium]
MGIIKMEKIIKSCVEHAKKLIHGGTGEIVECNEKGIEVLSFLLTATHKTKFELNKDSVLALGVFYGECLKNITGREMKWELFLQGDKLMFSPIQQVSMHYELGKDYGIIQRCNALCNTLNIPSPYAQQEIIEGAAENPIGLANEEDFSFHSNCHPVAKVDRLALINQHALKGQELIAKCTEEVGKNAVKALSNYINMLREQGKEMPEEVHLQLGCCFGACIIFEFGGQWLDNMHVQINERVRANPLGMVWKHFMYGEEDDIYGHFAVIPGMLGLAGDTAQKYREAQQ